MKKEAWTQIRWSNTVSKIYVYDVNRLTVNILTERTYGI